MKCNFSTRMVISLLLFSFLTLLLSINARGEGNIAAFLNLLLLQHSESTKVIESPETSYELQKTDLYIDRHGIREDFPGTFVLAVAYADFDNDGDEDVFMAGGDGSPNPTKLRCILTMVAATLPMI